VLEPFLRADDSLHERELSPQPRANVLFEAGMAMAHFPDRTVLLQVGWSGHSAILPEFMPSGWTTPLKGAGTWRNG
jgi:Predicted nucleotide-binding protein containing TIR-like domain